MRELDEPVLPDDYPVYYGYAYICDGKPTMSSTEGTVLDLKRDTFSKEVRRCDLAGRGYFDD